MTALLAALLLADWCCGVTAPLLLPPDGCGGIEVALLLSPDGFCTRAPLLTPLPVCCDACWLLTHSKSGSPARLQGVVQGWG